MDAGGSSMATARSTCPVWVSGDRSCTVTERSSGIGISVSIDDKEVACCWDGSAIKGCLSNVTKAYMYASTFSVAIVVGAITVGSRAIYS